MLCRNTLPEDDRFEDGAGSVVRLSENEGGLKMVLGIENPSIWLAYVLSIAGAVLCVGYGIVNWNKGEEPMKTEDVDWAKEEKTEVEDAL